MFINSLGSYAEQYAQETTTGFEKGVSVPKVVSALMTLPPKEQTRKHWNEFPEPKTSMTAFTETPVFYPIKSLRLPISYAVATAYETAAKHKGDNELKDFNHYVSPTLIKEPNGDRIPGDCAYNASHGIGRYHRHHLTMMPSLTILVFIDKDIHSKCKKEYK